MVCNYDSFFLKKRDPKPQSYDYNHATRLPAAYGPALLLPVPAG